MTKFKIILTVIIGLVLTVSTSVYLSTSKIKPVSHAAVKVILKQTPDYLLTLKSLSGEDSYSSDYKLPVPYGYYLVKIFDNSNRELFSGKVEKNRVSFPPYDIEAKEDTEAVTTTLIPLNELTLILPYFKEAEKIVFYDENKSEKLQVNIDNILIPTGDSKKLCGNGICDSGENIIFCYNDCRLR